MRRLRRGQAAGSWLSAPLASALGRLPSGLQATPLAAEVAPDQVGRAALVAVAGAAKVTVVGVATLAVAVLVSVAVLVCQEPAAVADLEEVVPVDSSYHNHRINRTWYVLYALATLERMSTAAVAASLPAATVHVLALFL